MRVRTTLCLMALTAPALAVAQTPPVRTLDFSGLVFGSYLYRTDSIAKNALGGESPNRFDMGRAYLNFRVPAGERGSVRLTTDLYQNTGGGGYYAGWAIRLKFAFFQYDLTPSLFGVSGMSMNGRIGMIPNFLLDHVYAHWPRWVGQDALETHFLLPTADVGIGSTVILPDRRGEVQLTLVNGNGYTAAETDRFKDVAARFTWTPFANDSGFLRALSITPWYSKGRGAGAFASGGVGQVGPGRNGAWTDGVQRDRRGIFAGIRDRRFTSGLLYAQRLDELEAGANTAASPRTVRRRVSDVTSAFAVVRPTELSAPAKRSRLSLFARFDDFTLDDVPATASATRLLWGGIAWDVNTNASVSLDYQRMQLDTGPTALRSPTNTLAVHWVVNW